MYVIILEDFPETGKLYFYGISNELHVTFCNSLDVCVHYNDGNICRHVCSRLNKFGYRCYVEVIA